MLPCCYLEEKFPSCKLSFRFTFFLLVLVSDQYLNDDSVWCCQGNIQLYSLIPRLSRPQLSLLAVANVGWGLSSLIPRLLPPTHESLGTRLGAEKLRTRLTLSSLIILVPLGRRGSHGHMPWVPHGRRGSHGHMPWVPRGRRGSHGHMPWVTRLQMCP